MKLRTAITSITIVRTTYDPVASLRGTGALTGASEVFGSPTIPDVTSNQFTTIFTKSYRVEDIGNLEVLDLGVTFVANLKGDGEIRLQISGNGDVDANYVTIYQAGPTGFPLIFIPIDSNGAGYWITSIQPGDNKLSIRLQARAISGTVSTQIDDRTSIFIVYRKKVLA